MSHSPAKPRKYARKLTQLLTSDNGVAVVETVLTMGLIAGLVILATATLNDGSLVQNPFADMPVAKSSVVKSTTDKTHNDPTRHTADTTPTISSTPPRSTIEHGTLLIATCWTALLLGIVMAGHGRIRRKQDEPGETEAEDQPTKIDLDHRFAKRQDILRILSHDMAMLLESRLTVRQLMSRVVTVIPGNTRREEIRNMMLNGKIRHLLVCRNGDELQGVISDRDVHQKTGARASDLMTPNPLTVSPDSAINPAISLLVNKHISCLPVVEDGHLIGVLTTTDLMLALQCSLQVLHQLAMKAASDEILVEPSIA